MTCGPLRLDFGRKRVGPARVLRPQLRHVRRCRSRSARTPRSPAPSTPASRPAAATAPLRKSTSVRFFIARRSSSSEGGLRPARAGDAVGEDRARDRRGQRRDAEQRAHGIARQIDHRDVQRAHHGSHFANRANFQFENAAPQCTRRSGSTLRTRTTRSRRCSARASTISTTCNPGPRSPASRSHRTWRGSSCARSRRPARTRCRRRSPRAVCRVIRFHGNGERARHYRVGAERRGKFLFVADAVLAGSRSPPPVCRRAPRAASRSRRPYRRL